MQNFTWFMLVKLLLRPLCQNGFYSKSLCCSCLKSDMNGRKSDILRYFETLLPQCMAAKRYCTIMKA